VISEALALLTEQQHTARIRQIVSDARQEVASGEVVPFTPELIEKINAGAEQMLRGEVEPDPDAWP
jgi:hypothetical protein